MSTVKEAIPMTLEDCEKLRHECAEARRRERAEKAVEDKERAGGRRWVVGIAWSALFTLALMAMTCAVAVRDTAQETRLRVDHLEASVAKVEAVVGGLPGQIQQEFRSLRADLKAKE